MRWWILLSATLAAVVAVMIHSGVSGFVVINKRYHYLETTTCWKGSATITSTTTTASSSITSTTRLHHNNAATDGGGGTSSSSSSSPSSPLSIDNNLLTVITTCPVSKGDDGNRDNQQDELIKVLQTKVVPQALKSNGFVSMHMHKSIDNIKVATYEQWTSVEYYQTFIQEQREQVVTSNGTDDELLLSKWWSSSNTSTSSNSTRRHVYKIVDTASNLDSSVVTAVTSEYPLVHFAEFNIKTYKNQLKMIELAKENLIKAMKIDGLISATFHQSIDYEDEGSDDDDDSDMADEYKYSVINYGQWKNVEAIENLKKQPGFSSSAPYWDGIANNEHHLYTLVSSHVAVVATD